MKKGYRSIRVAVVLMIGLLFAADATAQQGFRTNRLVLDDDAGGLGTRNSITLLSPQDGTLTADYSLRFPDQTGMTVGAMMYISAVGGSTDMSWLAPATDGDVLQLVGGVPTWQTILLLPTGTTDNSTLRWDQTTGQWLENVNMLSDAAGNTTINGTIEVNGASATINSATITTPNVPGGVSNDTNVVLRNAANDLVIRSINDLLSDATLSQNAIWVGDASNNPAELAAGTLNQVLQIDATGAPTWQTILLLPTGTTDNSTLRWDQTTGQWLENVNMLSDAAGNTTVNGTIEVNGATATINSATVSMPNVPAGASNDTNVVLRNAANDLVIRSINDLLSDATLSQNAIWVGDASNNPAELAAGTLNQVLQIDATGAPTWQTILLLPTGTTDNSTLRWDQTTGQWLENVNMLSDAAGNTTINGTIEVNGATATINSATITTPNIPAGAGNDTNVVLRNAANDLVIRSINDLLSDATLSQNAIWVGDASNNPAELAAGTLNQVLQIDATGAPTWQTILLLPTGTTDNSTLRWDQTTGQWLENVNMLSDAAGNTTVNGTIEVNGATATINSATITTPNIPAGVDNDTNLVVRDANDNLVVRSINELIDDATLSHNAIWVGDASNNPEERPAGTVDQVLQIAADGSPQWQTLNLIYRGRIGTVGAITQVVADVNVTGTGAIMLQYEDPANGARIAMDVIARTPGTDFTVGFSALPPAGTFINYTIIP